MAKAGILALLLGASFPTREAGAQALRADSLTSALAQLPSRDPVRIAHAGGRVTGRPDGLIGDTLLLIVAPRERMIPIASIDSVWRSTGTNIKAGARTGAIIGALAGGFLGSHFMREYALEVEHVIIGGIVGATGGAVALAGVGAVIGSTQREWRLVFRR